MKKFAFLALVVAIVCFLSLVDVSELVDFSHLDDNHFPNRMYKDIEEANNKVSQLVINDGYSYSLMQEANLIAQTIEKGCIYDVKLLYKYADDYKSFYVVNDEKVEYMNRNEYRQLYAANFFLEIVSAIEHYKLPTNGEAIGVIITWYNIRDKWGNINTWCPDEYSLCDIDGDGKWDYYGYGDGDFGSGTGIPEEEYVKINECCEVAFVCRHGRGKMPDYEKSPTFRTIKSLLS